MNQCLPSFAACRSCGTAASPDAKSQMHKSCGEVTEPGTRATSAHSVPNSSERSSRQHPTSVSSFEACLTLMPTCSSPLVRTDTLSRLWAYSTFSAAPVDRSEEHTSELQS